MTRRRIRGERPDAVAMRGAPHAGNGPAAPAIEEEHGCPCRAHLDHHRRADVPPFTNQSGRCARCAGRGPIRAGIAL
jgi:hypothetical protein